MNPKDPITPRWLTLSGAARYCGLSERTIENYIKDGLIVSAKGRTVPTEPRVIETTENGFEEFDSAN